jgi:Putative Flp pilus-assembly TadE/G-like
MTRDERGQILVLFAILVVGLIAIAALAIDVSSAYSARQGYRTVADAAALAGAQDLQAAGSRAVQPAQYLNAMADARGSIEKQFAATAKCVSSVNRLDCTFATLPYQFAIVTPLPSGACVSCDTDRSVQVNFGNPTFQLSFAHVLGIGNYKVAVTSVAGLSWSKSYAVVTLRPRAKLGNTFDVKDIVLDGGTHVTIKTGDVATNSDMVIPAVSAWLKVDPGFGVSFADPQSGPDWVPPPPANRVFAYVADANYRYPAMSGSLGTAPQFSGDVSEPSCLGPGVNPACTRADLDPLGCGAEATWLKTSVYAFMATQAANTVYCYNPGIYAPSRNPYLLKVAGGTVALFMPGAYYFTGSNGGLQIQNNARLLGGYRDGVPGVALMFDECLNTCIFDGTGAQTIALNVGTKFPPGTSGVSALAALDWDKQPVQTSGPSSPTPPILMTLMVTKDNGCLPLPPFPGSEPLACDPGKDKTLNMAGGGSLAVEGVQYAPTDNIEIHGGSSGTGQVGQIWAWTLFYSGGTQINQQGAGNLGPGILRLDAACTAPGTPCIP